MTGDPVTPEAPDLLAVVRAGHRHDGGVARAGLTSPDPRVRDAALGASARAGALCVGDVLHALDDPYPAVRRRACDVAAGLTADPDLLRGLERALGDTDALVTEAAAWALGEQGMAARCCIDSLSAVARDHRDARAREAAVAALGALGDPGGLPAVLAALKDRPPVRRRAVVALAAFDGDEVRRALVASSGDRDWQVREVAEILLGEDPHGAAGAPPGR